MFKPMLLASLVLCGCNPRNEASCPALPPVSQTLQLEADTFDIMMSGPDTGQVVLLLQGFPDRSFEYRTTMPRLAAAGYRTIAAIRREASPQPTAENDPAAQVLALADALALQRFYVAGAQLAWDVAKRAPERVLSVATTSQAQIAAMQQLERTSDCATSTDR